jgi:hypothetical protein
MIYQVYLTFKVGKWIDAIDVEANSPDEAIDKVLADTSADLIHISCEDIEADL